MARIRSIKPDVWSDPAFVECSPLARLMWIGTWNHADDYGVLKDDPGRLKLQILPGDACDASALVDELVAADLLVRKVAKDGTPVLVVRTFCVHQKIDKRATGRWGHPDEFTDPPDPPPLRRVPPPPHASRPSPTNPADSPPIPPIPNGSQPSPTIRTERTGTEGKGETTPAAGDCAALTPEVITPAPTTPGDDAPVAEVIDVTRPQLAVVSAEKLGRTPARRAPTALDYPADFEAWWTLYPRKLDKHRAHKAWVKARRRASWDDLLNGLKAWVALWEAERRQQKHIPYAEKWLESRSWQDPPQVTQVSAAAPEPASYGAIREVLNARGSA